MAKSKTGNTPGFAEIRNLKDGPRSYLLKDGSSLLLPGKHRGAVFPVIDADQVGDILRDAEKRGLIKIAEREGGDSVGAGNAESDVD